MNELRQLARRFVSGEIDYKQFRREFGPFFSRSDADPSISRVCEMIESESSAFEHGIINEMGLRLVLVQIAYGVVDSRTVNNPVQVKITVQQPVRFVAQETRTDAPVNVARVA